jgi:hypothetical protein
MLHADKASYLDERRFIDLVLTKYPKKEATWAHRYELSFIGLLDFL